MVIFPRNTSAGSGRGSSFSSCTGDGAGWGGMPRAALRSSRSLLAAARAFSSRSTAVSIFSSGFLSALKRARSSSVTGMAISGVNRSGRPAERSVECRLTPWTRCSSRRRRFSSFFSSCISRRRLISSLAYSYALPLPCLTKFTRERSVMHTAPSAKSTSRIRTAPIVPTVPHNSSIRMPPIKPPPPACA